MNYLLIANGLLVLFFLIFWFVFRKFTFFQWNRIFLIGSMILSFLLPTVLWINIDLDVFESTIWRLPEIVISNKVAVMEDQGLNGAIPFDIMTYLPQIYWIGVAVCLGLFIFKLYRILRPINQQNPTQSYSFLKWICVGDDLKDNSVIRKHEEIHRSQGHSIDLLLVELFQIFNWFNPLFYFFKKELKLQHEFLVDNRFDADKVTYAEMLVAYALKVDRYQLSHEFSNQSLLKERIKMIFQHKTKSVKQLYYLLIIPISLAMLTLIVNCKGSISKANDTSSIKDQPIIKENVLDEPSVETMDEPVKQVVAPSAKKEELIRQPEPKVFQQKKQIDFTEKDALPRPIVVDKDKPFPKDTSKRKTYAYGATEIIPEYPGGFDQFRRDVQNNLIYTSAALEAGVKGISEIQFEIDVDGNIGNFKVIRELGYGIEESAIASMKKSKKWKPAIQDGKKVIVKFTLPIRLDLTQM
ncbi:energy transducer TonB [Sphingobacterium sp. HJSM2_6]|uniref:energy transducer TonB n=1 Tax=Sphingobacterium sp. HJSM2_6 TaxID=3366264 RepID=UPI003BBDC683